MTTTGYITVGNIRGQCPHVHTTIKTASACLDRDARACDRQGGYSDRCIKRLVEGQIRALDLEELQELTDRILSHEP